MNSGWLEEDIDESFETPSKSQKPRRTESSRLDTSAPKRKKTKRVLRNELFEKDPEASEEQYRCDQPEPLSKENHSIATGNIQPSTNFSETSVINLMKFMKIKPFPPSVPTAQKFETWMDYRKKLRIQFEQCGNVSQRFLATLLYTNVGEEVERIISSRNMMPEINEVAEDFPHFEHLVEQLDNYFRSLSDSTVNYNILTSMEQKPEESAHDFHTRIIRQAETCGMSDTQAIRNQFIKGMRDREHAIRAFTDGTELNAVVAAASRRESLAKNHENKALIAWTTRNQMPQEVASLANVRTDSYRRPPPYNRSQRSPVRCKHKVSNLQRSRR